MDRSVPPRRLRIFSEDATIPDEIELVETP
jgi:hypothetical protein